MARYKGKHVRGKIIAHVLSVTGTQPWQGGYLSVNDRANHTTETVKLPTLKVEAGVK